MFIRFYNVYTKFVTCDLADSFIQIMLACNADSFYTNNASL